MYKVCTYVRCLMWFGVISRFVAFNAYCCCCPAVVRIFDTQPAPSYKHTFAYTVCGSFLLLHGQLCLCATTSCYNNANKNNKPTRRSTLRDKPKKKKNNSCSDVSTRTAFHLPKKKIKTKKKFFILTRIEHFLSLHILFVLLCFLFLLLLLMFIP